jgi:hypothetical protein
MSGTAWREFVACSSAALTASVATPPLRTSTRPAVTLIFGGSIFSIFFSAAMARLASVSRVVSTRPRATAGSLTSTRRHRSPSRRQTGASRFPSERNSASRFVSLTGKAHCPRLALAERLRREADRIDPSRVRRPRGCLRRSALTFQIAHTREIAARSAQAGGEADLHRIAVRRKHNGNRRRGGLGRKCRRRGGRGEDGHLTMNQISNQFRQTTVLPRGTRSPRFVHRRSRFRSSLG